MIENIFKLEKIQNSIVAGTDEVGRGPWAGPVVAAAVVFKKQDIKEYYQDITDSKKLTEKKRQRIYQNLINDPDLIFAIASVASQEIDQINILQASLKAMNLAINKLSTQPEFIFVDGNYKIPGQKISQRAIVKGDSKSISIAAASIIAKVYRDDLMQQLSKDFPHYAWDKNKGYGTKLHQDAIAEFGICSHHRKSFAPIKAVLEAA
jgi:ribonuclease HII